MRIRLRIDSLLLNGVKAGPHQAQAVRRAIERELSSRLAVQDRFQPIREWKVTATVPALTGSTPEQVGAEAGAAIHGSLPRHAE
jgi:hypothetical protein